MKLFSIAILGLVSVLANTANAGFLFSIQNASFTENPGGPTSGVFQVLVTPNGLDVGGSVVAFTANVKIGTINGIVPAITFGTPTEAVGDLFPGAAVGNLGNATNAIGGTFTGATVINGTAGLMAVPFTIAAGAQQTGDFTVVFETAPASPALANVITRADFSEATPTFQSGTITITAVPEPSSLALIGIPGAVWAVRRWRGRKAKS